LQQRPKVRDTPSLKRNLMRERFAGGGNKTMATKGATDREKSTRAVVTAAETHANEIAAGMNRVLEPYLAKGETMPDTALLARLMGRWLDAEGKANLAADVAHEKELADDAAPREQREQANAKVRQTLIDLRAGVDATYGPAGLKKLGLDQAVPGDPSVVATTGWNVLNFLEDASIKLPAPRKGLKLDRKSFAEDLKAELPNLDKALKDVAREIREAEATLAAKRAATESNDRAFSRGAGWLSATCMAAGLDDISARIKPSARRAGQTETLEQTDDSGGGTTGT
jgi:hypothetical protein